MVSCKTTKTSNETTNNKTISVEISNCPENGVCTLELIPNKSLEFKTDHVKQLYPIIKDGDKTLFKLSFTKNENPDVVDSSYQEVVYAELDADISDIDLTNEELKNVKLYYGRLCFCRDEGGYFEIKRGNFSITKIDNNSIKIHLDFSTKNVPKLLKDLDETISFKI